MTKFPTLLAAVAPSATTLTDIYTVSGNPANVGVENISVCNRWGTDTTFRLAISPKWQTIADSHYLYYDVAVPANDTIAISCSFNLWPSDVVRFYAGNWNLSVRLDGFAPNV